jgi:hypothetical protein
MKQEMKERREWAIGQLWKCYEKEADDYDPVIRLGELLLLLPEIEIICDQHCRDFQIAQLFEVSGTFASRNTIHINDFNFSSAT